MGWNKLTIRQFQELYDLERKKWPDGATEFEKDMARVAVMNGLTLEAVEDMDVQTFQDLRHEIAALDALPAADKLVGSFRLVGSRFRINTDARRINAGQYNEAVHFIGQGEGAITENLHLIMATLVVEEKRALWRWHKVDRDHAERAEILKDAPFIVCYHAALFFCRVYETLFLNLRDYFLREMSKDGTTMEEAERAYTALLLLTRGNITP
jgi:hypothetical protein